VLVGAGVGDDEVLGGGHHRVEEELAVLAAAVALTRARAAGEDVVAVEEAGPREDPVVEAEQADDAVRHRAHRHHRADGERAGAEVGPRRPAGQATTQQGPDVGEPQLELAVPGFGPHTHLGSARQLALELRELPGVVGWYVGEVADTRPQRVHPLRHRTGRAERGQGAVEAVEQLGHPPGQVDLVAADVVERQARAEVPVVVAAHRDAQQDPVEAGAPGVLRELVHRERRPRLLVETPPDTRARDPAADPLELVVGEAEPAPARLGGGEVEHLRGGHPAAAQLEEHPGHGEQRVRADQRPVGELDPQPVRRVPGDPDPVSGLRTGGREPEPGGDQRRVRLDVRAHHQDVAGLEGRVVLEQADQHLAQHVDLARGSVARVHLEAAVGRVVVAAGPLVDGGGVVGAQVGLQQTQQRRPVVGGWRHGVAVGEARSVEGAAQLTRVAPERGQQRVADQPGRLVVLAGDGSARAAHAAERVPEGRRGLREVEVHVAALAERPSSSTSVAGNRVCPNSDNRGGRSRPLPPRAGPRSSPRAGRPAPARPRDPATGATARAATPGRRRGTRRRRRCPGPRASR
jgi:hypothetical protein